MTLSNWISDATPVRARLAGQSLAFPSNKGFAVWNQFLALEVTGKMPVLLQTPVGQASRRFDCEAPKPEHSGPRFSAKPVAHHSARTFLRRLGSGPRSNMETAYLEMHTDTTMCCWQFKARQEDW